MKRNTLIISLALLLVLVCGYFFIDNFINHKDVTNKISTITVYSCDTEKIVNLAVRNSDDNYTFIKNGDVWTVKDRNVDIMQTNVIGFTYDFANVTCDSVVEEDAQDLEKYGLDIPSANLTVTLDDGTGAEFLLGGHVPGNNGYYFMKKGDNTVYSILNFRANNMLRKLDYYRVSAFYTADPDQIDSIRITGGRWDIEIESSTPPDGTKTWDMTKPFERIVYASNFITDILTPIAQLKIENFVEDKPDDLGKYMLSEPAHTLTVGIGGKVWTFLISEETDGIVYFKEANRSYIYSAPAENFAFLDMNPFSYIDKYVYLPENIMDLKEIAIKKPFETTISLAPNDYKIDGVPVEKDTAVKIFSQIFGLTITEEAQGSTQNAQYFEFSVTYNDGHTDNVAYAAADELDAAAYVNGESQFVVLKKDVDSVIEQVRTIVGK